MISQLNLKTRYYKLFPADRFAGYAYEDHEALVKRSAFVAVDVYGIGSRTHSHEVSNVDHDDAPPPELTWRGSGDVQEQIVNTALLPALRAARAAGMYVVYLNNSAPKIGLQYSEFAKMQKRQVNTIIEERFAEDDVDPREYHYGESGYVKISELLSPKENEYFVRKHVYSGFVGTRFDLLLRYLDVKTLFMVGFSADACLLTTVIDALWHDYKVILLRDCTLANELPDEQAELLGTQRMVRLMESLYCVSITSTEFIEALSR